MSQSAQQAAAEQSIEYSVYIHHHPAAKKNPDWEMVGATTNMKDAVKQAEELHASGEYRKVEVKQKYFDPKNNRQIDMVLKVLEHRPKKPLSLLAIIVFTIMCGAAAFGLTVFLVGGKPAAESAGASPESPADHP